MQDCFDIVIAGAGVVGTAIARELSKLSCSVLVLERGDDVCSGTSKANSAIVHAGYDAEPGSLMAKYNVLGNRMMEEVCRDLDVPFERIGSLVVATDEEGLPKLEELKCRGEKNGVEGLEVIGRERLAEMEPNISDAATGALWAPSAGIVDPFVLTIAQAENAFENGVQFRFGCTVDSIRRTEEGLWEVGAGSGRWTCRAFVNAAGCHAAELHNLVSAQKMEIVPRRGEYLLLDKRAGGHVHHTIFCLPTKMGKGILVTPTCHGNLILGPTADDIGDADDTATTAQGLAHVAEGAQRTVKDLPLRDVITSFAGNRAHRPEHEFAVGEVTDAAGIVDCAGIESPGLTSAPALGVAVAGIVQDILSLEEKPEGAWKPTRRGIVHMASLPEDERRALIVKDPAYGRIVCRCECVSEGEIVDAIRRPLGARSLDAIKRRVRCGMGRCQGGFCTPKVMDILAREVPELSLADVSKKGPDSRFVEGRDKDRYREEGEGR